MRHLTIIILGAALLSGCTGPSYSDTLEQKLAGKTPDQQRNILAQQCSQEINAGVKPNDQANVDHFRRMQTICQEMTGKKVPLELPKQ